jgi:hypothetical protein
MMMKERTCVSEKRVTEKEACAGLGWTAGERERDR